TLTLDIEGERLEHVGERGALDDLLKHIALTPDERFRLLAFRDVDACADHVGRALVVVEKHPTLLVQPTRRPIGERHTIFQIEAFTALGRSLARRKHAGAIMRMHEFDEFGQRAWLSAGLKSEEPLERRIEIKHVGPKIPAQR